MSRITISNIAKHISHNPNDDYENEDGTECVQFTWDYENEKIDKIAEEEFRYALGDKKKNLMWVEKLKEVADWKEGEYIYAYTKTNADGYYNVFYKKDKVKFSWFNTIIEPSGYVCMEAFNHYTMDTDDDINSNIFIRVNSVYNDKNCDKKKVKPKKEKAKPKKEKNTCECCGASDPSVGLATGENGVEMWVCRFCDTDGSNYDGWGDVECYACGDLNCVEPEDPDDARFCEDCFKENKKIDAGLDAHNLAQDIRCNPYCKSVFEDTPAFMERMRIIVQNEYGNNEKQELYEWIILNKPTHKIRKNQKKEKLLNLIVLIKAKII